MKGRNQREALRQKYFPKRLEILFIGESPPAGGTFFYTADSLLFEATRDGFLAAFPDRDFTHDFLQAFRKLGCYLEDLCPSPVNRLPQVERKRQRSLGEPVLAGKLAGWNPNVIIVTMLGIAPNVRVAMREAGLVDAAFYELPFPRKDLKSGPVSRYDEYVNGLTQALGRLGRDGVINISVIPSDQE